MERSERRYQDDKTVGEKMKIMTIITIMAVAVFATSQVNALSVSINPEHPEPGDKITVSLPAESNVSGVTIQVCVGDICRLPEPMEKVGDEYIYSFYVNETADVHLNFTIAYSNGTSIWDDSTHFKVEKSGGGSTPGFASVIAVSATAGAFLIMKRRTKL